MGWTVEYANTAKAQLRRLDRNTARRVLNYMDRRVGEADNPRQFGHALTGPLGGLWTYRVADCRVVCDIQDNRLVVLVVRIGRRDRVYR